jgi:hypothetical protein
MKNINFIVILIFTSIFSGMVGYNYCLIKLDNSQKSRTDIYENNSYETETNKSVNIDKKDEPSLLASFIVAWWWYILFYTIGLKFAVFIYRDANKNEKLVMNIKPLWWGLLTALDPPLGLLAYWLIHYSKLNVTITQ